MLVRPRGFLLGIASLFLLAGCSATSPDDKPPSVTSTPATATPSAPPPVTSPLNASKYHDKPCDLVTDEQAQVLGYPLTKRPIVVLPDASICEWQDNSHPGVDFSIKYSHDGTDRFANIYRGNDEVLWRDAVSITIAGQPALKQPGADSCSVLIGLSTTESMRVHFKDAKVDSCDRAVRIAEDVVRNVRG